MQSFEEFAQYILDNAGHNKENQSKQVHIIVDYPQLEWGDFYKYLMTLTWMTGRGWGTKHYGWGKGGAAHHNVIFARTLDEACQQADQYDHAIVSYVGTVYRFPSSPTEKHISEYFNEWIEKDQSPCAGHILWHPDRQYGRMHQQCMFLNLKHWRDVGRPTFGKWTGKALLPEISKDNVHDDYTPFWIKPGAEYRDVNNAEMAQYISKVLESGKPITNFRPIIRHCKYFTYPQREEKSAPLVADQTRRRDILYTRNTSQLNLIGKNITRKYDVIYAPASGNVGEYLWSKFGHKDSKLVIFDNFRPAVLWKQVLIGQMGKPITNTLALDHYTKIVARRYNCLIDDASYKSAEFLQQNQQLFSDDDWIQVLSEIKYKEAIEFDILKQDFEVDPTKSNLIYLTNIFSYVFAYHEYSLEYMDNKFNQLLKLPNTTVIGQSPFRKDVVSENHSS